MHCSSELADDVVLAAKIVEQDGAELVDEPLRDRFRQALHFSWRHAGLVFEHYDLDQLVEAFEQLSFLQRSVQSEIERLVTVLELYLASRRESPDSPEHLVPTAEHHQVLQRFPESLARLKRIAIERLLRLAERLLSDLNDPDGVYWQQAQLILQRLLELVPDHQRAAELLVQVEAGLVAQRGRDEVQRDAAQFPPSFADFGGPGDPTELAASARRWLDLNCVPTDRPGQHVAVVVTGQWYRFRDGSKAEPSIWALPVHAALRRDHGPWVDQDVALVLDMAMLCECRETVDGPRWTGVAVGSTYEIRLSRVIESPEGIVR